jgi:hypothetical protein
MSRWRAPAPPPPTQPLQLLKLLAGQPVAALALVGLVLADPVAQRLMMHPKLAGDVRDRPARVGVFPQPHGTLVQFDRVLAWCCHR